MENLIKPDEMIACPYESVHRIRRCKMAQHIIKCRKNHKDVPMVVCDFHASHLIPEPERQYHHRVCEYRKNTEAPMYAMREEKKEKYPLPQLQVEETESWDNYKCTTYNPQEYVENNNIMQQLNVRPKAELRQFRMKERARLSALANNAHPSDSYQGHSSRSNGPNVNKTFVRLPPSHHRAAENSINVDRTTSIEEMIKRGANKVYMQHDN